MNKFIFERNAVSVDLLLGESKGRKGTEVYEYPHRIIYETSFLTKREKLPKVITQRINEAIKIYGKENLILTRLVLKTGQLFEISNYHVVPYTIDEILNIVNSIESITIGIKPKLLGYIALSHFKENREGQIDFIKELIERFKGKNAYESDDVNLVCPDCFAVTDDVVVVEDGYFVKDHETEVDFDLVEENEEVVDMFWRKLEAKTLFTEKTDDVVIWVEDYKTIYFAPYAEELSYEITYFNDDRTLETDSVWIVEEAKVASKITKLKESLKKEIKRTEIESYLYNILSGKHPEFKILRKLINNIFSNNIPQAVNSIMKYAPDSDGSVYKLTHIALNEWIKANLEDLSLRGIYQHIFHLISLAVSNKQKVLINSETKDMFIDNKKVDYVELFNSDPMLYYQKEFSKTAEK